MWRSCTYVRIRTSWPRGPVICIIVYDFFEDVHFNVASEHILAFTWTPLALRRIYHNHISLVITCNVSFVVNMTSTLIEDIELTGCQKKKKKKNWGYELEAAFISSEIYCIEHSVSQWTLHRLSSNFCITDCCVQNGFILNSPCWYKYIIIEL